MGEWIQAQAGDTLCGLAVAAGYANCQPLRDHNANAALRNRQLQPGDRVYVPELTEGNESIATETVHTFVRPGVPLALIRFVHGSPDRDAPDDDTLDHLNVSNYRTDRAGRNATEAFAGADHWRFDTASDADPDAFKVEVRDARSAATRREVLLEALHPVYIMVGSEAMAINVDEAWSSAAERNRRQLAGLAVRRTAADPAQRFRSAYLRLVVDEQDQAARPRQTLLVTDDQPNEERVEILDQDVRATYILEGCPVAPDARCRVTAQVTVGETTKRRIRLCVGIFRRNIGDATGFNGAIPDHLRHRVFRWFRRVYAQANMAPKVVDPGIRLLDPPPRNMLTISNLHGNPAAGRTAAGASPSRMSFTVSSDRGGGVIVNKNVVLDIPRPASAADRLTPLEVANLLVTEINDADFTATSFENPPAIGRPRNRRSADIIIRDSGGGHVSLSAGRSNDASASLLIATVNLNSVRDSAAGDMEYGHMDERQIIRNFDSGDDRLDCYVVGRFSDPGLRGRSFTPCYELDADYQPPSPFPFSCIMATRSNSGPVMDGGNNLPYTFPHEAGHALLDCFHTGTRSELMAGGGTSTTAALRGTRRLADDPVRIVYANYHPTQTWVGRTGNFYYEPATRLNDLADGASAAVFEAW